MFNLIVSIWILFLAFISYAAFNIMPEIWVYILTPFTFVAACWWLAETIRVKRKIIDTIIHVIFTTYLFTMWYRLVSGIDRLLQGLPLWTAKPMSYGNFFLWSCLTIAGGFVVFLTITTIEKYVERKRVNEH